MDKKTILITGCSTGIGLDAALALKKRGHQVIASCRKIEDVQRLQALQLDVVLLDVADSTSVRSGFVEAMKLSNNKLDVLINNAGFGQGGALEDITRDVLRAQFETNVFGLMELTNCAIPMMRKQGYGRIINVSSVLGLISMPFRGAYNASKYAVEGLSDTLRLELHQFGIDVITIQPGPIDSKFRDNVVENSLKNINISNSYYKKQYEWMKNSFQGKKETSGFTKGTDAVIVKMVHAIESKRPHLKYPVTLPTYLFIFLKRFVTTRLLDRLLRIISRKELS